MKSKLYTLILVVASATSLFSQTVVLSENFDSVADGEMPTDWISVNNVEVRDNTLTTLDYARSGTNSLWIVETRNSNVFTTAKLNLAGASDATLEFYWTTDAPHSSKFGRVPQVQYSSDGTNFATIGTFTVPTSTTIVPAFTLFSQEITTLGGYSFTSDSVFRIVGDNDGGGSGGPAIIDDFTVTSFTAAVPEPSSFALLAGCFGLAWVMVRRRS